MGRCALVAILLRWKLRGRIPRSYPAIYRAATDVAFIPALSFPGLKAGACRAPRALSFPGLKAGACRAPRVNFE